MPFRDNLQNKIDRRLRGMAKKYYDKKSLKSMKDVTFIGVHIRRTDHLEFMKKKYSQDPLEEDYYNGGFQLLDLIIMELKSHMTCYNSMPLIG